jgi:hypothetical protein
LRAADKQAGSLRTQGFSRRMNHEEILGIYDDVDSRDLVSDGVAQRGAAIGDEVDVVQQ